MRIELLGPLRVLDGHGEPLNIGGRPRALLIRLALEPGRVVGFGTLVEDLWADELPADPAGALHTVVARLRRAVGRDAIGSHPAGYRLDLPRAAVDAAVFEDFVAAGRAAGDPMRLLAALALWRGEPVPEVAGSAFGRAAVVRWTELRLAAVEAWADVAPAGDVLPELTSLHAAHPLRESLAARLMLALCRAGRRPDALLVFDRTRRLLADELGVDPGAELRAAHLEALRTDVPVLSAGNLPARLTSFLGRDVELAQVRELLGQARLVTLTGVGGVGKTRLAVEVAASFGGWLVELAALDAATSETGIVEAILAALGARSAGPAPGLAGPPRERLRDALAGRDLLLVLDNCEHVLDAAARVAHESLTGSAGLRVLATSREPLGITGEVCFPVSPLRAEDDAVALFADRAAAARGGRFALTERDAVARICRELDGIPLAIELAAARLRTVSLPQLAEGLSDRFRLLDRGSRVALDRHRTLRSVVDWSWELLTGVEQTLLRRLSVFAGGASLVAAETVCGIPGIVESLVDKSLVVLGDEGDGRYRLLATVQEYATEKLAEAGESERFRVAHAEYFLALAETAEPLLRGPEQLRWLATLDAERDNLDSAVRFAIRTGRGEVALRLVAARAWAWFIRGQGEEACYWATAAIDAADVRKGHAFLVCSLLARGTPADEDFDDHPALLAASMMGHLRNTAGLPALRQYAVDTADRIANSADPWQVAAGRLLHGIVQAEFTVGGVPKAEQPLLDAVERFRVVGDRWGMMYAHYELSTVLENRGDYAGAVVALDESRRLADEFGGGERLPTPVLLLVWSALLRTRAGQLSGAAAELELAGRVAVRLDEPAARARVAHARGELAEASGESRRALEYYRAAWELIRDRSPGRGLSVQLLAMVASDLALAEAAHGEPGRARPLLAFGLSKLADTLDGPARAYLLERAAIWSAEHGGHAQATAFLAAATAVRGLDEVATAKLAALQDQCAEVLGEQGFRAAWHDGQGLIHPETLPLP